MTREETAKILVVLKTAYPSFYRNSEEVTDAINLWSTMFADDNPRIVMEAVKSLICTLKYPPTIADIKEKINLILVPKQATEMEAWSTVLDAIKDANYNASLHFENFPDTIKKIVGSPGQLREWAQMDSQTVNSVVQSNFMRSYTEKVKQNSELAKLPQSTKDMMQQLSEKLAMKQIE